MQQPDLNKLKSTLLSSKIQQSNPPLYQVINNLIDAVRQFQGITVNDIASINETINNINNESINNNFGMGAVDGQDELDYVGGPITLDHNHTASGDQGGVLTNDEHDGFSDYSGIAIPATPASGHARIYTRTGNGHTQFYTIDQDGTEFEILRDQILLVRNTSGDILTKGDAVDIYGATGSIPNVRKASANSDSTHAEGVMAETVADNGFGLIYTLGLLAGTASAPINTSAFTEGNQLYLSNTPGVLSATPGLYTQGIGIVIRAHATLGEIFIYLGTMQPLLQNFIGPPGYDGIDGEDSYIPGPIGLIGPTGLMGMPGMDGISGEDGFPIPGPANSSSSGSGGLEQTFTNLEIRTSPDNNLVLTTVIILKLDQWIADDGTVVTDDLSNNTALITASGAGGLDTGSEAASVWYEIYRIRKSSDGTLNTIFHRALDWTSDTSFTTATDVSRALRLSTLTATDKLAQGITFASSALFPFVDIQLVRAGAVSGNIWLTLESDSAGVPSGSVLATSDKLDASLISTSNQIIRFIFRTPYSVTASTQYHLVLQADYTRSDTVNISWRGVIAGGYTGGIANQYNGAAWIPAVGVGDFYFNAFCEFNNTALTYPSGYDQKCKIGYVYNNSGSDLVNFVAINNDVTRPTLALGTNTNTFFTLYNVAALMPPTPCLVTRWLLENNTAGALVVISSVWGPTNTNSLGLYMNEARANAYIGIGMNVPVEFQYLYLYVDSGMGDNYIGGFRW